jgi:hypothetical protein
MVKCPGCEKELIGNPKFCPECGAQINKNVKPVDEVFKRRHSRRGLRLVATVVIIIFVVAAFAYVFFSFIDINGFLSPGGISGTWEGSGTFTNNCDNPACKYVGTMNPPSVILQLQQNGNMIFGTVTINIPQPQELLGQPCLGFDNSISDINNGILSSTRLTFMDDGGNIWTLNFLSDNCQGTVGSNAIGCTGLQGDVSLSKK